MGSKTRSRRKTKTNRGNSNLQEWRVLKSFELTRCNNIKKSKKVLTNSNFFENEFCVTDVTVENTDKNMCVEDSVVSTVRNMCVEEINERSVCVEQGNSMIVEEEEEGQSLKQSATLLGRRIIHMSYFLEQLKKLSNHAPQFGCNLENMDVIGEISRGLRSGITFKCNMCLIKKIVWTEPKREDYMSVNTAAVAGVITCGGGFTSLQKILGAMDIHCMNQKTFDKNHDIVAKGWEMSALREMKSAAEEEITLAIQRGDVDEDNVPLLTVVADGSWAKRSYRKNYNSLSGMAAIVGYHTKKVLYFGVKNKYCVVCARYRSKRRVPRHTCFKNWNGSSSSMEPAVIVEGFLQSMDMYGVKYATMIADGDSSVYLRILESRPYDNLTVKKIECRNHLLRNYCNRLRDIVITSLPHSAPTADRRLNISMRKIVGANILRCRAAVTKAVEYRNSEAGTIAERSARLMDDLVNGPSHIFGEHRNCVKLNYFCKGPKEHEINYIPDMKKSGIYEKIMAAVSVLTDHCQHLIHNVDSNFVEQYNSVIARFTGGKRINYSLKGSYQARCAAAVVSHNTGREYYHLHKTLKNSSPGSYSKLYEYRSNKKIKNALERRLSTPKAKRSLHLSLDHGKANNDYGPLAQKPDLDPEIFSMKAGKLLEKLKKTEEEIANLEISTREQSNSDLWIEERRMRLTASNFGLICKRRSHSCCGPVVKRLLYSSIESAATIYGRENEKNAIKDTEAFLNIKIKKCGLFVDKDLSYLAATPDGLIGDDGIVEIKCPYSGRDLTPDEIIKEKKGIIRNMWQQRSDGSLIINTKHSYYFQVQGQLHISKKKYCKFILWTNKGIKVDSILKDDLFWKNEMEEKLTKFYMACLLPEIIDPRRRRSMPIREPSHILEEQKKKKTMLTKKRKTSLK